MPMFMPIVMIVIANTVYNLCSHATPQDANPFASILVTYITSGLVSMLLLLISTRGHHVLEEFRHLNWASIGLGFGIVLLECGFIMAFRVGWKISTCALVANLLLAIVLFIIGVVVYHDAFSVKKLLGLAVCMFGLYLVNQ